MDFIKKALALAKKARPSPNPRVGAVIVNDGKIIGSGYHKSAGDRHAEIVAIDAVKNKNELKTATLYVTLEPCSHYGKTPPCTDAIIAAGIKKTVVGCDDRNPKIEGIEKLRSAGLTVELLNDSSCQELNEGFFHWIRTGKPFVLLKLAMTLDGRIATKTGDSKYISNTQSRTIGYSWRDRYDAIMVGINTVRVDDPRLTARTPGVSNPIRIVVDSHLTISLTARFLQANAKRIIATTEKCDKQKKKQLEMLGAEVWNLPSVDTNHVDLEALFAELGRNGVTSIIVEGGGELATTLLEKHLINKCTFFIAAKILGAGKHAFEGAGVQKMDDAWKLKNISIRKIQDNVLIEGYL